jgi:hypothetical protein
MPAKLLNIRGVLTQKLKGPVMKEPKLLADKGIGHNINNDIIGDADPYILK